MWNLKKITGILTNDGQTIKLASKKTNKTLIKYEAEIIIEEIAMKADIEAWEELVIRRLLKFKKGEKITIYAAESTVQGENKKFYTLIVKGIEKKPKSSKFLTEQEIHQMFLKNINMTQEQFEDFSNSPKCQAWVNKLQTSIRKSNQFN